MTALIKTQLFSFKKKNLFFKNTEDSGSCWVSHNHFNITNGWMTIVEVLWEEGCISPHGNANCLNGKDKQMLQSERGKPINARKNIIYPLCT